MKFPAVLPEKPSEMLWSVAGSIYRLPLLLVFLVANVSLANENNRTKNPVIDAGSQKEASAYYERIRWEVGFDFKNSSLDQLIAYLLYSDSAPPPTPVILGRDLETMISHSDFQRGPDARPLPNPLPAGMKDTRALTSEKGRELWSLQARGVIKTATFFAPKIVNYARPHPYDAGWRKLVYIKAQPGSRAEISQISGAYILFNYAGNNNSNPAHLDPLMAPGTRDHAISKNNQIILIPDFDTLSGGREFRPGKFDTAYFAVYGPFGGDGKTLEQECFDSVDGNVAWNQSGNTSWVSSNVINLCAGTTNPASTVACFESEIANHNNWQEGISACSGSEVLEQACFNKVQGKVAWSQAGHTGWNSSNVEKLCAATVDPDATISCFKSVIDRYDNWSRGISACRASTTSLGSDYKVLDYLEAGFDIDDGAATLAKYYVPNGCAHCHGHDQYDSGGIGPNKIYPYVKPNYIDTDNLYQAMKNDFYDLAAGIYSEPLLVNQRQGSRFNLEELPEYRARFDVIRDLNQQMLDEGQFARRNSATDALKLARENKYNDLYQFGGAETWLFLHSAEKGTKAYEPVELPTVRGYGFTVIGTDQRAWKRFDPDHINLLEKMDQYCFRCHSTIKFSALDLNSIGRHKDTIISYVKNGGMPPGRTIPKADRDCIVGTLKSLFVVGDYPCKP